MSREVNAAMTLADRLQVGGLSAEHGFGDWIGYAKMIVGTTAVPLLGLPKGARAAVLRRTDADDAQRKLYVSMCAGVPPSASTQTGVPLNTDEVITLVGRAVAPRLSSTVTGTTYARIDDYTLRATKTNTDLRTTFAPGVFVRLVGASPYQETVAKVVASSWNGANDTTVEFDRYSVPSAPSTVYVLTGDTPVEPLASVLAVASSASAVLVVNYFGVDT